MIVHSLAKRENRCKAQNVLNNERSRHRAKALMRMRHLRAHTLHHTPPMPARSSAAPPRCPRPWPAGSRRAPAYGRRPVSEATASRKNEAIILYLPYPRPAALSTAKTPGSRRQSALNAGRSQRPRRRTAPILRTQRASRQFMGRRWVTDRPLSPSADTASGCPALYQGTVHQ